VTQALFVHTWAANDRRRVAGVVSLEVTARLVSACTSVEAAMLACTSGVVTTHTASSPLTARNTSAVGTHQRHPRYSAAGNRCAKEQADERHAGLSVPVIADLAAPPSRQVATSAGSGASVRTIDR